MAGRSAFGRGHRRLPDEQVESRSTLSRNRRVTKAIEAIDDTALPRRTTRARWKTPTPAR